jgi:hypothetical protein
MPAAVGPDTLRPFVAGMEEESFLRCPRDILKRTINAWNRCSRDVPGWPPTLLRSPPRPAPDTLPPEQFPQSFQADVARRFGHVSNPDPVNFRAPVRALRPATIEGQIMLLRRFASALVHQGAASIGEVTAIFFESDNLKRGLRHFLKPTTNGAPKSTLTAHQIARLLLAIARHLLRLEQKKLDEIAALCQRLDPQRSRTMGRRNRSYEAMRSAAADKVRRHTGLRVSPHLHRHFVAKVIVEANPALYLAVSRHLGHKSINTTLQSYLGSETGRPAASSTASSAKRDVLIQRRSEHEHSSCSERRSQTSEKHEGRGHTEAGSSVPP